MTPEIVIVVALVLSCLLVQSGMVSLCLFCYVRLTLPDGPPPHVAVNFAVLSLMMLMLLIGHLLQIALWGTAFVWLGAFNDFKTSIYFSGVSFTCIGYGDIVLDREWYLLGPIEGVTGLLMVGVSTAVMAAAIMSTLKRRFKYASSQSKTG